MNLGVYVTAKNDEIYITDVLRPVMEVFPQIVLIDLGSTDGTVGLAKKVGVPTEIRPCDGTQFTCLLNEFSQRHDWVVWIDSDEIFSVECLLRMKEFIGIRSVDLSLPQTVRTSWKMIREKDSKYEVSNEMKVSGHKAFNTKIFKFVRSWPRQVLKGADNHEYREPEEFNGVWCWHAVLLPRSTVREATVRYKKRLYKFALYDRDLTWTEVGGIPWKEST